MAEAESCIPRVQLRLGTPPFSLCHEAQDMLANQEGECTEHMLYGRASGFHRHDYRLRLSACRSHTLCRTSVIMIHAES